MVYCGKPSRACHACRSRKTRCDARPEGCTQCERAHRECPGYRALADLVFRDQSSNVARKAKARESKSSPKSSQLSLGVHSVQKKPSTSTERALSSQDELCSSHDSQGLLRPQALAGSYSLTPSLEDRATCYFISNYVVGMRSPGVGFLDSLESLYRSNYIDSCLVASVKAAGLASYAHHSHSRALTDASQYQYMKAIQFTNAALGTPEEAKKDSTLVSIMILGVYEILTGCDQKSMKAWAEHINGAAALLELRGYDQVNNVSGRRLLLEATNGILTSCLQRSIRIPDYVIALVEAVYATEYKHRPELATFKIMLGVSGLLSDISDKKIVGVDAIVANSIEIDEPLASVSGSPPAGWEYQQFYDERAPADIAFRGRYDVCLDLGYANLWNGIRMMRILIHEAIRNSLLNETSGLPEFAVPEHTAQFQRSTQICLEMQLDMLASVPQSLGWVRENPLTDNMDKIPVDAIDIKHELRCPYVIGDQATIWPSRGYALLWPLWVAGCMDLTSDEVRWYCIKNLERIAEMGIRQARVLAESINTQTQPRAWDMNASLDCL